MNRRTLFQAAIAALAASIPLRKSAARASKGGDSELIARKLECASKLKSEPDSGRAISVANGDFGRLYDANGDEIKHCIRAYPKTGFCFQHELDPQGKVQVVGDSVVIRGSYHPAPLRFERRKCSPRVTIDS